MSKLDARDLTIAALTHRGITGFPGLGLDPLDFEEAARVYDALVVEDGILVPAEGLSGPDDRPVDDKA